MMMDPACERIRSVSFAAMIVQGRALKAEEVSPKHPMSGTLGRAQTASVHAGWGMDAFLQGGCCSVAQLLMNRPFLLPLPAWLGVGAWKEGREVGGGGL